MSSQRGAVCRTVTSVAIQAMMTIAQYLDTSFPRRSKIIESRVLSWLATGKAQVRWVRPPKLPSGRNRCCERVITRWA